MAIIINGNKISQDIRHEIKEKTLRLTEDRGITPGLAVILVGEDPASRIYVRKKKDECPRNPRHPGPAAPPEAH
jgi:methylenetetrahydrofolate dehydrogenase (NADP+)/methenyltetrahydrofolate cyclohydrolase